MSEVQTLEKTQTAAPQAATQNAIVAKDNTQIGLTTASGFELAQRAANALSKSSLVPQQFQNNLPNCLVALNMANRIGADPLMVMQNLYVVHGRPSWSSQFLIATFNTCGRFSAMRFEFKSEQGKDDWACRAWAVEKDTGEKIYGSWVDIALAKKEGWYSKNGSKWQTMPQQMLMYRAAAFFVRAIAPELAMGLHTREENEDIILNASAAGDGSYVVADDGAPSIRQSLNAKLQEEKPPVIDAETVEAEKPKAEVIQPPKSSTKKVAPKSCGDCAGTGYRVGSDNEQTTCDACEGTGKV